MENQARPEYCFIVSPTEITKHHDEHFRFVVVADSADECWEILFEYHKIKEIGTELYSFISRHTIVSMIPISKSGHSLGEPIKKGLIY